MKKAVNLKGSENPNGCSSTVFMCGRERVGVGVGGRRRRACVCVACSGAWCVMIRLHVCDGLHVQETGGGGGLAALQPRLLADACPFPCCAPSHFQLAPMWFPASSDVAGWLTVPRRSSLRLGSCSTLAHRANSRRPRTRRP